jgi:hypothetical protein
MLSRMPVSVVTASVAKIGNVPAEKRPGMTIRGILVNELRGSVVTPNVVMLNEMKPLVRTIRVTGNGSSHHVILTNEQMSQFSGTLHSVVTPSVVTLSGTSLNGTRLNEKVVGRLTKPLVIRKTGRGNPGNVVMPSAVMPSGATIRHKALNVREKIVNNGMSCAKPTNGTQLHVTSLNGRLPSVVTPSVETSSVETSNENRNPYRSNGSKVGNGVLNGKALHGKAAWQLRSTRIIPFLPQIKPGAKTG